MYAEDEELVERVSDDEPQDDDAMDEGDGGNDRAEGQQVRSRSGRDVPDDEPPLEGYER